ncbi:proto-oncogene serine/threonine-protein kinase mos [Gadus chalcogrammus]|uniref:proto-oncogene serine/threonine-protein kinase mos n=1 Tax=Gadus chalcogrammus TaxID=1042646 RepID=UPI0024C4BC9B|nr:proto-oncogene serine/threonine-protein kinase mos [Gadus chalcogrammus]
MPSPIPVTRLLPKDFYPSLSIGVCSSPLTKYANATTLNVPAQRLHGKVASKLWSSVIHWKELQAMQQIGSGGFGSVYKATYFGDTIAVKKVKKCSKNKLASRQSFWAELNAAHLRHKNVVHVIAATTCVPANSENENNIGTILMEYVGSRNLHHIIYGSADALGKDTCLRYSADIVQGLRFLHSHGIVHLDIKPANVLVSNGDICKIVDFGSSVQVDRACEAGSVTPCLQNVGGTYTHRAPELLKGESITPKADIFSFGITLWQLITREQPYPGDREHVLYAVVAYNLRPPLEDEPLLRPTQGVHALSCRTLVCRCWSGEAASRPTAEEVLVALEELRSRP